MEKNVIITISRQFGSNGREIARILAEYLDISYYNKEILERIAVNMGVCADFFKDQNQDANGLFTIESKGLLGLRNITELSVNTQIYDMASDFIQKISQREDAVIVGRCADYIFRDHRNVLNIYIYAPVDARYKNCVEVLKMKPEEATKMIYKVDKARTVYHKRYAKYALGDPDSKQIMIDSSMLGVRGTAEILAEIVQKRFGL